MRADKPV